MPGTVTGSPQLVPSLIPTKWCLLFKSYLATLVKLQMKRFRIREARPLVQGHTARNGEPGLKPGPSFQ